MNTTDDTTENDPQDDEVEIPRYEDLTQDEVEQVVQNWFDGCPGWGVDVATRNKLEHEKGVAWLIEEGHWQIQADAWGGWQ